MRCRGMLERPGTGGCCEHHQPRALAQVSREARVTLPSRIRPSPENPPLRRPNSGGLNEPTTYILVVGGFQNVTSITFFDIPRASAACGRSHLWRKDVVTPRALAKRAAA